MMCIFVEEESMVKGLRMAEYILNVFLFSLITRRRGSDNKEG